MTNRLPGTLGRALGNNSRKIDRGLVKRAWVFANLAHSGQKRFSGDPYVSHLERVATTLSLWNLDTEAIVAGLLHDAVQSGGATSRDLVGEFGEEITQLVDGVTKMTQIRLKGSEEKEFVENLRKMLLVMASDLRVVLVKLADRIDNMRTLKYLQPQKRLENAKETLEIYAPLAERLGIGEAKGQLEDYAFPYVYPSEYLRLKKLTRELYSQTDKYIRNFRVDLVKLLRRQVRDAEINIRHKHLYSLFRKLQRPEIGGDLSKIYDITAARVLVKTVEQCYLALGLIHGKYRPVPFLGVSDFIANPKPNGYKSIHTKVFGPEGRIVELQIRTLRMHEEAETGVAAHWHYSSVKQGRVSDEKLEKGIYSLEGKLSWIKQLVSWQQEITDNKEYLKALRFDALQHRNLVFSPKGDVYDLPKRATPVDYAYSVHTQIGHQIAGAKVNGKLVSLDYKLVNGDVVEIILDRNRKKPSRDWLEFVVTRTARHEIAKALKH